MNPRKRLITIIGIIIILLLGAGIYYFFIKDLIPSSKITSKVYSNTTYNYQFSYPENYTLTEFSPDSVILSLGEGEAFSDSISINTFVAQQNDPTTAGMNFDDYAAAQAKMFCNADGTVTSASCTAIAKKETFTTKSGLKGDKISFTREVKTVLVDEFEDEEFPSESSEAPQPTYVTETSETAPVYIFDISSKYPASKFTVLMVSNPLYTDMVIDTDKAVAQSIAQSLEVK